MPDTENCGRIPRKIPKTWSAEVVVGAWEEAVNSLRVQYGRNGARNSRERLERQRAQTRMNTLQQGR